MQLTEPIVILLGTAIDVGILLLYSYMIFKITQNTSRIWPHVLTYIIAMYVFVHKELWWRDLFVVRESYGVRIFLTHLSFELFAIMAEYVLLTVIEAYVFYRYHISDWEDDKQKFAFKLGIVVMLSFAAIVIYHQDFGYFIR